MSRSNVSLLVTHLREDAEIPISDHAAYCLEQEISLAIDALGLVARRATELRMALEGTDSNQAARFQALAWEVNHAGYSNTVATAVTEAVSHMALAHGIVMGVAAQVP